MSVRALVLVKKLDQAKSRLAGSLPPAERRGLVLRMASHVVEVLTRCVDETILLTGDHLAGFAGVSQILDVEGGMNVNVERALTTLPHRSGDALLVIAADLPLLVAADVAALLAACSDGVAIATDRHGLGTNAIGFGRHVHFRFAFGPDSRARHAAEARRHQLAPVIVTRHGLALDVDDIDSLQLYRLALNQRPGDRGD